MELEKKNGHIRDKQIVFDEGPHKYYINGSEDNISVTTYLHNHLFPHFDSDKIIKKMMNSKNWQNSKQVWKFQKFFI